MKTLFLFQDDFMKPQWFELEGDYSRLHKTYINGDPEVQTYPEVSADERVHLQSEYEAKIEELNSLVYDVDEKYKIKFIDGPTKDWDFFVECGFVP